MINSHESQLSSDQPLDDPADDRLGYALFAERLAASVQTMIPTRGLVIALYGAWGSGKSTVLGFVEHYLSQKPVVEQPLVVNFNPWWFSGQENLTRQFFNQLLASLDSGDSRTEQLRERLADFAELVSKVPVPYAWGGEVAARLLRPEAKDVVELKEKVSESIAEQQRRILIVIDDIDRLNPEEIRLLFRVVKAVADFPNVTYLLAFDQEAVSKALTGETQIISGQSYLEKIIQVPFELPLPDEVALRNLLFEKLDAILQDTPEDLFDSDHWSDVYWEGIDHFIKTPVTSSA